MIILQFDGFSVQFAVRDCEQVTGGFDSARRHARYRRLTR
jgi:hypothetical protein